MSRAHLADLQAFAAVARLRSFRRAAVELGLSPSALSHTLRGLEARLGVRLLNRTTRSVAPTEAGLRLMERLAPALDNIESALEEINAFRDSPVGMLRINAPRAAADWVIPPLMSRFLAENPGMRAEVVSSDALVDIVAGGFDAGVRFGESLQQDMVAVPLGPPQRLIVVASPAYLARRGIPRDPRALRSYDCICFRFPSGVLYRWEFSRGEERLEVEVDGRLTVGEMPPSVRAAEDGVGLAYVFEQYARAALDAGRLVTVLDDWCPPIPGFFLYYPGRQLMPAGLRAFVDLLQRGQTAS